MTPEALYVSIGRLIEMAPNLASRPVSSETQLWLARAYAFVSETGDFADAAAIKSMTNFVNLGNYDDHANLIMVMLYRALAVAELAAPAAVQGMFVNAGNPFDAMVAMGKVLGQAKISARIIDPYMDEKALSDFAVLADESIRMELLSDAASVKPSFAPAVARWRSQNVAKRPLEARLSSPRSLHDRLVVIDNSTIWMMTQSLNALAARSPATIVKIEGDAVPLKLAAYEAFWNAATPLL